MRLKIANAPSEWSRWLRRSVPSAQRAVLVVTELIVQALGGWVAVAAADLGIDVYVFDGARVAPLRRES